MTHSHPLPLKQIPYQHPELSASDATTEEMRVFSGVGEVLDCFNHTSSEPILRVLSDGAERWTSV